MKFCIQLILVVLGSLFVTLGIIHSIEFMITILEK